jgi:hypothetical protein
VPRKIDHVKIIVSLIEETSARLLRDFPRIIVFSDLGDEDRLRAERALIGFANVEWLPLHFSTFVNMWSTLTDDALIIVCGQCVPFTDEGWIKALDNTLALHPDFEEFFATELGQYLKKPALGADIIVEAGYGKFRRLEFDLRFIKQWQKFLRDRVSAKGKTQPFGGWGFAALPVSRLGQPNERFDVQLTAQYLQIDPRFSLHNFADEIFQAALPESGTGARPSRLMVSTPLWRLSAFLYYEIKQKYGDTADVRPVLIPDTIYGWHPIISFVEMIAARRSAMKLLHMESFYRAYLLSCTTSGVS